MLLSFYIYFSIYEVLGAYNLANEMFVESKFTLIDKLSLSLCKFRSFRKKKVSKSNSNVVEGNALYFSVMLRLLNLIRGRNMHSQQVSLPMLQRYVSHNWFCSQV